MFTGLDLVGDSAEDSSAVQLEERRVDLGRWEELERNVTTRECIYFGHDSKRSGATGNIMSAAGIALNLGRQT